jgi:hypothetical protein
MVAPINCNGLPFSSLCAPRHGRADAKLNTRGRQIDQRLTNNTGTQWRLVAAQRASASFRDAESRFFAFYIQRDGQFSAFLPIGKLKPYLTCGGKADLGRPVPARQ